MKYDGLLPGAHKRREAVTARIGRATGCDVGHCSRLGLAMAVFSLHLHCDNPSVLS